MMEFIQIKGYVCKIQLAREKNKYFLSQYNVNDGSAYVFNASISLTLC